MFRRVILESWHQDVPYICFTLIAVAFLVILFRAIFMKPADIDRLAHLPLENDGEPATSNLSEQGGTQR